MPSLWDRLSGTRKPAFSLGPRIVPKLTVYATWAVVEHRGNCYMLADDRTNNRQGMGRLPERRAAALGYARKARAERCTYLSKERERSVRTVSAPDWLSHRLKKIGGPPQGGVPKLTLSET
jgi:hypothetical protein